MNYNCMPKDIDEYYKYKTEQKLPDKMRVHYSITFIQNSKQAKLSMGLEVKMILPFDGQKLECSRKNFFWGAGNILFLNFNKVKKA